MRSSPIRSFTELVIGEIVHAALSPDGRLLLTPFFVRRELDTQTVWADDRLVSNVARPEMLVRNRPDRGFDWFCHAIPRLRRRIVGKGDRFVAGVLLADEVVFIASVRLSRRWKGISLKFVEDSNRSVGWSRSLLSFDPLDKRLVPGSFKRELVFSRELPESFVFVLTQLRLDVLGVVTARTEPSITLLLHSFIECKMLAWPSS